MSSEALGTYLALAHFLARRPLPLLTSLPLLPLASLARDALLTFPALTFFMLALLSFTSFVFAMLLFLLLSFPMHTLFELEHKEIFRVAW